LSPVAGRIRDQSHCFEDAVVDAAALDVVGQHALIGLLLNYAAECVGESCGTGLVDGQQRINHGRSGGGWPQMVVFRLGIPR
jgi:hypothetical protein